MPTSAFYPPEWGRERGFSLLELLIVLALASIMVAMVAPRLSKTIDAIAVSGERLEVQRQLEALPLLARQQGRAIMAPAQENLSSLTELPDGWSVMALTALHVRENGVCMPARLRVEGGGVSEEWGLGTPDCRVVHGR